ncbi:aminomethyl-transferring glycine dehydrogenase subunit GcvPA [Anaerosalibacter bizertensis]|uniref:Probable glycine dehydrogenase (decarboxylating) subunit 1 n=1 Tax=Anaerosalibacter bizertensis TaxID=932217 RepID=A0A844FEB7_9FIRM|nr:aminomethyl-transferring glycine dehydrogenase subunit GcvPA [Anaerosalibacter bizertensis]MBV1817084.1 aminomethyl-transferring glycine dehydrogenase subunit GcvPA [Bacteroidales bacterium MSK.15.36]MBU5293764.1 aminomethyl-transferring glycine dehydrogenase subunit GcvPA [Anaerosalibacter bizertensis]MCG4564885.1 aminomethyl-transferring glycine dehydrogenase subunit GcvPA [Anaerosalibacter bizertensis]MCG4581580.1 aminomethyl-transferring glycine dehydrogenase subunit GcvPA [Anaerosalibac
MYPYIPNTNDDERKMLESIGVNSIEELFNDIPEEVKLNRELNLNKSMSEIEVKKYLINLATQNKTINDLTCFLGAGAYDHYIPSIVDHIISKSEFYTSYTPYQAEISQGTLQYIFEYQTLISNLTGMDVSNASLYDGGSALGEASIMASNITRKDEIIVSKTVHPDSRRVLETYAHVQGLKLIEIDELDGTTNLQQLEEKINENTAAVIVQSPNFFGIIEDIEAVEGITHSVKKTMLVVSVDPISLGILKSPGELGADIVVGEGQSLGIPLSYGGPYLGFIATKKKHMRKLPGRIVGQSTDVDGKRAFVLTLQAREQHIRRDKATSNICTNQGLNVLASVVYMVTLGKKGLREVATQSITKAHYAYDKITATGKYKPLFDKPFFKEFAITSNVSGEKINDELLKENILGGFILENSYPQYENGVLYCVTEKRTKKEIDTLASVLEGII